MRGAWLVVGSVAACGIFPDADSVVAGRSVDDAGRPPGIEAGPADDGEGDAGEPIVNDAGVVDAGLDGPTPGSYAHAVLADDPVAYLPLDEESGLLATDASGHGHVGTLGGAPSRIGSGKVGRGLDLAGNGAVSLGNVFDFDAKKPYSLELWLRLAFSDSAYRHLFDKSSPSTPRRGYGVYIREGTLTFERWVDDSQVGTSKGGDISWLNQWIQVVAVYDGSNLSTYVNGEVFSSSPDTRSQLAANSGSLVVGAKTAGGANAILGAIDEIAIYAKALSPTRIRAHYVAALAD